MHTQANLPPRPPLSPFSLPLPSCVSFGAAHCQLRCGGSGSGVHTCMGHSGGRARDAPIGAGSGWHAPASLRTNDGCHSACARARHSRPAHVAHAAGTLQAVLFCYIAQRQVDGRTAQPTPPPRRPQVPACAADCMRKERAQCACRMRHISRAHAARRSGAPHSIATGACLPGPGLAVGSSIRNRSVSFMQTYHQLWYATQVPSNTTKGGRDAQTQEARHLAQGRLMT